MRMRQVYARIEGINEQGRCRHRTYENDEEAFELFQKHANQQHELLAASFNIENSSRCQDKIPLKEHQYMRNFEIYLVHRPCDNRHFENTDEYFTLKGELSHRKVRWRASSSQDRVVKVT